MVLDYVLGLLACAVARDDPLHTQGLESFRHAADLRQSEAKEMETAYQ
jgi:hypothetical protein